MKILAIDSAAKQASLAVWENGRLLAQVYIDVGMTHSQTLMPAAENLLSAAKLQIEDIGLFAVSKGPGSFTGVRIGVAAAKGMAAALSKPCIGVSTLEAMAENLRLPFEFYGCAVMDARREQVYNALFHYKNGGIIRLCEDRAVSVRELINELSALPSFPVILVGDGADLCYNNRASLSEIYKAPPHLLYSCAAGVAAVAERLYSEDADFDPGELAPEYLRLSQAERERNSL